MDKEWLTIVQPIVLEPEMTIQIYQDEQGVPVLQLKLSSLDCFVYITIDAAELIGNMAKQVRAEFEHDHIH